MIIEVVERCYFETEDGTENNGLRTVVYEVEAKNLQEAYNLYENEFDSSNIISSNDDFEEGCDYSVTISVSLEED